MRCMFFFYFGSVQVKVEENVNACVTQQRSMTLTLMFYQTVEGKNFHGIDGSRVSAVIWMFLFLFLWLHKLETRAQTDRRDPHPPPHSLTAKYGVSSEKVDRSEMPPNNTMPLFYIQICVYHIAKALLMYKHTVGVYTVQGSITVHHGKMHYNI